MSRALKLIRQGRPGKRSPQLTPGPSTITPGGSLVAVLMVVAFVTTPQGMVSRQNIRQLYCSALNKSRAESPPRSAAAVCVDTNVLVYAADADSQFYRPSTTARVRAHAKR
jgi:hypothetical protein